MTLGLSHVTLITANLDRMQTILETVLEARCIYASGAQTFSIAEERFFLAGDVWIATMLGAPLPARSYNHIAFRVAEADLEARADRITALGLDLLPPRPRVEGEGRSVYFHTPDNHLIELHTGTLSDRLARYAQGRRA